MTIVKTVKQFLWAAILSAVPAGGVVAHSQTAPEPAKSWLVKRLSGNPIVSPASDPSIGSNINGPTIIRVPSWVDKPLAKYYLYFADHNGKYIRLALADKLEGPWKIYTPGTLQLADSYFSDHIASPEAIVDDEQKQIRLYYHGLTPSEKAQHTRVAVSRDGIHFTATKEPVGSGSAYWRLFRYDGWWYALAMPGRLYRSRDGLTPFEQGPQLFPTNPTQVHNAMFIKDNVLHVFYTRAGDKPERILYSKITLAKDWSEWKTTPAEEVLAPEMSWEGADLPVSAAKIGALDVRQHALRDPAIFQENGKTYLLYAIAGESGIGIAEIHPR